MQGDYTHWAEQIRKLHEGLHALSVQAQRLGLAEPQQHEWFDHLENKLLPQATRAPMLVAGVFGGTNTGKSLVFNHLAGEPASAVCPSAAGTKHPVCLTPPGFDDESALAALFPGFRLRRWTGVDDPLLKTDEHLLFWRVGRNVPDRLLLLDTPDVDANAEVHWERADKVRQAADVLVAVLTPQKYNDAAVRRFFRKAADAKKPVVVVLNQTDLVGDRSYWSDWLATFAEGTGAHIELLYAAPKDREAARELRVAFHRLVPAGSTVDPHAPPEPGLQVSRGMQWDALPGASLRQELAALHFDSIKIRTFRGALEQVLDPKTGAWGYLEFLRNRAGEFANAARALSASDMARVNWPALPPRLVVDEIRHWWDEHRSDWSRKVHGTYRWIGNGLTWPVRKAWSAVNGNPADPTSQFAQRERDAVVKAVEDLIDQLDRLAKVGNDALRPRLLELLSGEKREQVLAKVAEAHAQLPTVDDDYRDFLQRELDVWSDRNRGAIRLLKSLDSVAAVARPAITISLCVSGWLVAGNLVQEAAVQAAAHGASNLAAEAAITGGIAGGGEMMVSGAAEGLGVAAARLFRSLQLKYAELRAAWLAGWLERELLGTLLEQLRTGADLPQSPSFQAVEKTLHRLTTERQSTPADSA